jgi:hypothetical protein
VVVVLVVGVIVAVAANSGGGSSSASSSSSSSAQAASQSAASTASSPADLAAISKTFPGLVGSYASSKYGKGFGNALCSESPRSSPPSTGSGAPDLGNWATSVYCFGATGYDGVRYIVFSYSSAAAAQKAFSAMSPTSTTTDSKDGKSYTNARFETKFECKMVTSFAGMNGKSNFLLLSRVYEDSLDKVVSWWKAAPM